MNFFDEKIQNINKLIENTNFQKDKFNTINFIRDDELFHLLNYLYIYYKVNKPSKIQHENDVIFAIFEKTIQSQHNDKVLPISVISDSESNSIIEEYKNTQKQDIPNELQKLRQEFLTAYLPKNPVEK
jgi:hypothetical protein